MSHINCTVRAFLLLTFTMFAFFFLLLPFAGFSSANATGNTISQEQPKNKTTIPDAEVDSYLSDSTHLVIQSNSGNHPFVIELAINDAERAKGLMYRTKMEPDHGMLFDFGATAPVYMWMKNTYIPLDMLFLKADGVVHHVVQHTTPLSQSIIGSGGDVRYVFEVKSGAVQQTGVKPGDRLLHQLFTPNSPK